MAKRKRKAKMQYAWRIVGPSGNTEWMICTENRANTIAAFASFHFSVNEFQIEGPTVHSSHWRSLKRKGYRCEQVALVPVKTYKVVEKMTGTTADGWDVSISFGGPR